MDFSYSDEQQMLVDTTRRFIEQRCGFEARQKIRRNPQGYSASAWQELAELGLLALNVPEAEGGMDAGGIENMLVAQAMGAGLMLEPWLSSAVIATRAIATMGSADQRAEWLPALASAGLIAVLAHEEAGESGDPGALTTTAVAAESGWRIDGHKTMVYHAAIADLILVSARVPAESATAIGLFAIPISTPGLGLSPFATVDSQRAAELRLAGVQLPAHARLGGDVRQPLQATLDFGLAMLCADAFGALDRVLAATIEYSRSRVQFGVPIGSFQALQHRMADMLIHLEQARSMCFLAATAAGDSDRERRGKTLSAAKTLIGQAARYIGQQAVQLHGGMGMTDEMPVSHHFRRLLAFELRMGDSDQHLERYRQQLGAP